MESNHELLITLGKLCFNIKLFETLHQYDSNLFLWNGFLKLFITKIVVVITWRKIMEKRRKQLI